MLLHEICRHPVRSFAQMRGHSAWGPALIVSALSDQSGGFQKPGAVHLITPHAFNTREQPV